MALCGVSGCVSGPSIVGWGWSGVACCWRGTSSSVSSAERSSMIRTRNWFQVEVCGAVKSAGRCPSLCKSAGGCFCTDYPEPPVVLNVAELKCRCHRSHRVLVS
ncbi:MAG: hypothetical protein FJ023_08470 [Chloroflexi bacterium]|nr:hypothetical protein [Chloroflexota bacterium]